MSDPNPTADAVVHHLVRAGEWETEASGRYAPDSLETDGFIHFSTTEQVPATSLRYYGDVDDLVIVTVAVDLLESELRWEDLVGHGSFPHLYGPLNLDSVISAHPYAVGAAPPVDHNPG